MNGTPDSSRPRTHVYGLIFFGFLALSPWTEAQVMPMQSMSTAWSQPAYPAQVPTAVPVRMAEPIPQAQFQSPYQGQYQRPAPRSLLHYDGRTAWLMQLVPTPVYNVVLSANRLQGKPYKWGGGHRSYMDSGYDCSGSTSHVLMSAGLLDKPLMSGEFRSYGEPGRGRYVTIYAKQGHVFMEICGLRFDAGGTGSGPRGIYWRPESRSTDGWVARHPAGL